MSLVSYPSTLHLEGSKCEYGIARPDQTPFAALPEGMQIWEEKVDGDHCAIGFDPNDGVLFLQAHGRRIDPIAEPRFALFGQWARHFEDLFKEVLGRRYVCFFEWTERVHSVFYDLLPHYALEDDVYDRERHGFLSTPARKTLLDGMPIASVPVIAASPIASPESARRLLLIGSGGGPRRSTFKSKTWREELVFAAANAGCDVAALAPSLDMDEAGEGAYVKIERDGVVAARYKFILPGFAAALTESPGHWSSRRTVLNGLAPGADLFDYPDLETTP